MPEKFDEATAIFPERLLSILRLIPVSVKKETYELRIRKNKELVLFGSYGTAFVFESSMVSQMRCSNAVVIENDEFSTILAAVCGYSVYSHQHQMANGFITMPNGNRAAVCGMAVYSGGGNENKISAVSSITSLNIRISRNLNVCTNEIMKKLLKNEMPKGIIVAGKPCSGKTTFLKSLAKRLSSEYEFGFKKCVIIDERLEMGNDCGINCDVLSGYAKESGIIHAIRTLSPEYIICDEIAAESEAIKILKGLESGVGFIVSVHAESVEALTKRDVSALLLNSGGFDRVVLMDKKQSAGAVAGIYDIKELTDEAFCGNTDNDKCGINSFYDYKIRKNAL